MAQVLVAMSGGVDSSVAAALLLEQGHEVVGVTLKLWGGDSDSGCCSVSDVDDARRVAQQLGIDHVVFGFSDDFDEHVVRPYLDAHAQGRTPNPCIACNRHLKFGRLLHRAERLGFDLVATGHHCRLAHHEGVLRVRRGRDLAKDQSYVVDVIEPEVLVRLSFPVGDLTKDEVRDRARALGLRTADKPDSQDVCFVTRSGRSAFVGERIELHAADVVDTGGMRVGSVEAVELVTIGQRRGLGLAGGGEAQYVVDVDVPARTVVVGPPSALEVEATGLDGLRWGGEPATGTVLVQTSAHGTAVEAIIAGAQVRWLRPHRRVAPGQAVVAYDPTGSVVLATATAR